MALKGFWKGALVMQPRPVIAYDWYRAFIEALLAGATTSGSGKRSRSENSPLDWESSWEHSPFWPQPVDSC